MYKWLYLCCSMCWSIWICSRWTLTVLISLVCACGTWTTGQRFTDKRWCSVLYKSLRSPTYLPNTATTTGARYTIRQPESICVLGANLSGSGLSGVFYGHLWTPSILCLMVPYCTPFWSFILGFDALKNILYICGISTKTISIYFYSSFLRSSAENKSIFPV